jgi:hypothetical protein
MKYSTAILAAATLGVLALPLVSLADGAPTSTPSTVTVTIDLFLDGVQATASSVSANGDSFPMQAWWSAKNIGYGTGSYPLGPTGYNSTNAYEAVTSAMTTPASYHSRETIGWTPGTLVSGNCYTGDPYALQGYTFGNTLAEAEAGTPSLMGNWPGSSGITNNLYEIVWNTHCLTQPVTTYPANGAHLSSAAWTQATWTPVTDPYGTVTYYYESSNSSATNSDRSFASPAYVSGPLSTPMIPTPGTPSGTWYWHVKAVDSAGNSSGWSVPTVVIVK